VKLRYDDEADALYVRFAETAVAESEEVKPGLILDFDADGCLVALEILDASAALAAGADIKNFRPEAA
jgi:uncharacterized protein YuzE